MIRHNKYGSKPFDIAVIHGGPGAAGEMAPVALALSSDRGILEPLQTKLSINGQVEELKTVLEKHGDSPLVLIGFSWGAWLSFLFTAQHSDFVKKLILISSAPFEEKYSSDILETRLNRLDKDEREEVQSLVEKLDSPSIQEQNAAFKRFGTMFSKADAYDPIPGKSKNIDYRADIFQNVWGEAAELRGSGKLLSEGRKIQCPVVAIHGDHDPHPAEGVQIPLSKMLKNFKFELLRDCGHKPWIEKKAKCAFYNFLKKELTEEDHLQEEIILEIE